VNITRISADAKNGWCYTCIPPTCHSWLAHGQLYLFTVLLLGRSRVSCENGRIFYDALQLNECNYSFLFRNKSLVLQYQTKTCTSCNGVSVYSIWPQPSYFVRVNDREKKCESAFCCVINYSQTQYQYIRVLKTLHLFGS